MHACKQIVFIEAFPAFPWSAVQITLSPAPSGTAKCREMLWRDRVGVAGRLGPSGTLLCCAYGNVWAQTKRYEAQVPLRRVNQAYVIATSTSVDVGSVDVAKFDDAYFLKPEKKKEARAKKGEENFFQEDAEKTKARPCSVT